MTGYEVQNVRTLVAPADTQCDHVGCGRFACMDLAWDERHTSTGPWASRCIGLCSVHTDHFLKRITRAQGGPATHGA